MADQKISQLTEKTKLTGKDIITILDSEDSYTNKKAKALSLCSARTVYVDIVNGNDSNSGKSSAPLKNLNIAVTSGASLILVVPNTELTPFTNFQVSNINYPITIMLADMDTYSTSTIEDQKIYISGTTTPYHGLRFVNCKEVFLFDICVCNVGRHCFLFEECGNVECSRCIAHHNNTANFSGFRATNSNVKYYNCEAHDVTLDGFNYHDYGDSLAVNCVAYNCGDDGISHHNACTGMIIGGEFYNNGKGGISSPTYGAAVNMIGCYSHDNTQYGLYADGGSSGTYPQAKCTATNCRFENNATDVYTKNCKLTFVDTYYRTRNIVSDNTNFVEKRNEQFVDTTSTSPLTLKANTVYKLGTISSLEISNFVDDVREIEIQFTADTTFTFTDGGYTGKWLGVSSPSFDPNTSYVIAIKNGYAVSQKVGA